MAKYILINAIAGLWPGKLIDEAQYDVVSLRSQGAVLWSANDPNILAAAARAAALQQRGGDPDDASHIMRLAITQQQEAAAPVEFVASGQAAWHIDATAGNDGNDGLTAATSLKTFAELARRAFPTGEWKLKSRINLYFHGTTFAEDVDVTPDVGSQGELIITPDLTPTTGGTGSFTAVQTNTPSAGTSLVVTDTTRTDASWAAMVDKLIVITGTGTARDGAFAYVVRALGSGNQAELCPFIKWDPVTSTFAPTEVTPLTNDTYTIYDPMSFTGNFNLEALGGSFGTSAGRERVVVMPMVYTGASGTSGGFVTDTVAMFLVGVLNKNVAVLLSGRVQLIGCGCTSGASWATVGAFGGNVYAGYNKNTTFQQWPNSTIFSLGHLIYGPINTTQGNSLQINSGGLALGGGFTGPIFKIDRGATVECFGPDAVYGPANGAVLAQVQNGQLEVIGTFAAAFGHVTGLSASPFTLNGQTSVPAQDISAGTWSAARAVTIALLDTNYAGGGFGGAAGLGAWYGRSAVIRQG